MSIQVLWLMMLYNRVDECECFEGAYCLNLQVEMNQGREVSCYVRLQVIIALNKNMTVFWSIMLRRCSQDRDSKFVLQRWELSLNWLYYIFAIVFVKGVDG